MGSFEGVQFHGTFRSYQQRVLDNAESYLADGKINIVAAPGSGKTVLGLELIRRLGQSCLILSPTTAIREQWGQRFKEQFVQDETRFEELFSTDLHKVRLVNSITYQALYSAMEKMIVTEESETDCSDIDMLKTLKKYKIKTICLDEAHHLKNEWQKALEKFVGILDSDVKLIALTATPPYDSDTTEWKRYYDLCGEIDEEIFVPELVAQNTLCPHQDYIYFNYPTQEEIKAFEEHQKRAEAAMEKVGALEYVRALATQLQVKEAYDKVFEAPREYIALLILLQQYGVAVDRKIIKALTGKKELPKLERKYAETALQFLISDGFTLLTEEQKEEIIRILKEYQVYSKKKVSLVLNEALRRDLISSVGKLKSIEKIAQSEYESMGSNLRMLVLTDYIKRENIKNIATDTEFSSVNIVSIFETIRRANDTVNIGVLSGTLVILPESLDLSAVKHKKESIPGTRYCIVDIAGSNHTSVDFVGELFKKGEIQILVGTKSLLGEGWDAPCINSLILASFVGSFVLSNQMRGRAIRIDKDNPDKSANIWHLVTVEPLQLVAETAEERLEARISKNNQILQSWDFEVLKRRFDSFMGPNYETGEIESGIGRITLIEPPYHAKGIERINKKMLELSRQRVVMKDQWQKELRDRNFSVVVESWEKKEKKVPAFLHINWIWYGLFVTFVPAAYASVGRGLSSIMSNRSAFDSPMDMAKMVIEWVLLGLIVCMLLWKIISKAILHLTPNRSFTTLGKAVCDTLRECGIISAATNVYVERGYLGKEEIAFFLQLRNASLHDQNIFNTAITELLSPIENPRYILIKKTTTGKHQLLYSFACPTVIGRKKEYVEILAKNLKKSMGNMDVVYVHSEEGRRLILECRQKSYLTKNEAWGQTYTRNKRYALSRWE